MTAEIVSEFHSRSIGLQISNPKRHADSQENQSNRIFAYYAGYSDIFTERVIRSFKLPASATVLDPWNGSGTTTRIAGELGHHAIGTDLNPAMVVVAKAGALPHSEWASVEPLAKAIVNRSARCASEIDSADPLLVWFTPNAARSIRSVEVQINRLLVSASVPVRLVSGNSVDELSSLAACFYLALFKATREFLQDFIPSNPTWVKTPQSHRNRKNPSFDKLIAAFLRNLAYLATEGRRRIRNHDVNVEIKLGNAENLPVRDRSVDLIVTSPPYCTRIDYAMATSIELAVLGVLPDEFNALRRSLTGTSTVASSMPNISPNWGETCVKFLHSMESHSSKASKTYYLKNHAQYFDSLYHSISEVSRVLKCGASCILVAQTSHYKDLLNDVPAIISVMAIRHELELVMKEDFTSSRTMVSLNPRAKRHLSRRQTTESVLCFRRRKRI